MILINGVSADKISVLDRGLSYGDGVFTTLPVSAGQPLCWPAHWQRLASGCERLGIAMPSYEALTQQVQTVAARQTLAVIKCVITRGEGGRGYRPAANSLPTVIVSRHPWPDYPSAWSRTGIALRLCQQPLARNPSLAGIKHLNRLEQVLARREWDDPEVPEGLMLDSTGLVIEGTLSNLFFVHEQCLCTPDLQQCGIAGVMRAKVLKAAHALNLPISLGHYTLDRLGAAQEVFMTNSLIGIWPVVSLEAQRWAVGSVTARLRAYLADQQWIVEHD